MFKKSLAIAVLMLVAGASAAAPLSFTHDAVYDVYEADLDGVVGANVFTFSFPFDGTWSGGVQTSTTTTWSKKASMYFTTGTALTSVSLDGSPLSVSSTVLSTPTQTASGVTFYSWAVQDLVLASGVQHSLQIQSTGNFSGYLAVTPAVPEADSLAMAAAGLAVVALVTRRRKAV